MKAIQKLDFLVAIDVLPAEICGWADVVLPEATYLERDDDLAAPVLQDAVRRRAAGGRRADVRLEAGLVDRQGAGDPHRPGRVLPLDRRPRVRGRAAARLGPRRHRAQAQGRAARASASPPARRRARRRPSPPTSGKIELHSAELAKLGFDPLPSFYPPDEAPPGNFRLLIGRAPTHTFGRTTNNRLLAQPYPENEVWINADAARALPTPGEGRRAGHAGEPGRRAVRSGPRQGHRADPRRLRLPGARLGAHREGARVRARAAEPPTSVLTTRYKVDPIMGGTGMNVNFVRVEPVGGAA